MANRQLPLSREPLEVTIDGFTHGGEGVARVEGKAVFVAGTLPGERVTVRVVDDRRRWARAELVEIIEPSQDRVTPPCPYVGTCGGCDLQHASEAAQRRLKTQVVVEQLQRLGGLASPVVSECRQVGPALGYRNHARFHANHNGELGFHRASSNDVIPIDQCLLLTDATQATRTAVGDETGAAQVAVRAHGPGSAAVVLTPSEGGLDVPDGDFSVLLAQPNGGSVALRGSATMSATVGSLEFVHPADGFFQNNTAGAAVLIDTVVAACGDIDGALVWDLYAGVGLLSIPLAMAGAEVVAVEGHRASADHAELNAQRYAADVEVVHQAIEAFLDDLAGRDEPDVIVLDPPRQGAGADVVSHLVEVGPAAIVYVACDVAALARDTRLLVDGGWRLQQAQPLDLFPMTHHVEVVATFTR